MVTKNSTDKKMQYNLGWSSPILCYWFVSTISTLYNVSGVLYTTLRQQVISTDKL